MEGKISKRILRLWEAGALLAGGALAALAVWLFPARTWYWYLSLWLVGLGVVFCCFLWLPLLYESCRYTLTPEYIEYSRGVFFHVKTRMLRRSVMYAAILRGPAAPFLRTRSLVVYSMGGRLLLPWLPMEEAQALLQALTPREPALTGRASAAGRGKGHE